MLLLAECIYYHRFAAADLIFLRIIYSVGIGDISKLTNRKPSIWHTQVPYLNGYHRYITHNKWFSWKWYLDSAWVIRDTLCRWKHSRNHDERLLPSVSQHRYQPVFYRSYMSMSSSPAIWSLWGWGITRHRASSTLCCSICKRKSGRYPPPMLYWQIVQEYWNGRRVILCQLMHISQSQPIIELHCCRYQECYFERRTGHGSKAIG